jgi:aspartate/methionine/tyrosine aminotransferase
MQIDVFEMERFQSAYENEVAINLSESGVKPLRVRDLLEDDDDVSRFLDEKLGYPVPPGSDRLRERIASWYPGAAPDDVIVTNGGAEANYLASWTLLEKDARLAFMLPNYMQGWGLGRHFAAEADPFRLVPDTDAGRWALDVESLREAIGPTTSVLWVCNPNNPTGAVLTTEEMQAIVDAASKVGAWIISDEIYRGAELEGDADTPTFWGMYDRVVVTSGLSKAFGLPGLRLGWVVAPPELIQRVWEHRDYTTIMVGRLSDELASRALDPAKRQEILGRTRSIVREHVGAVDEWAAANQELVTYLRPRAGAIAYLGYDAPMESLELADLLRRERSVLVVPGAQLGLDRGFRVGFGYDAEKTRRGLDQMGELLRGLVPARSG